MMARYAAIEALNKSTELAGEIAAGGFFLAMAHWRFGQKEAARKLYEQAVARMDKNASTYEEIVRFRAEAAKLLSGGSRDTELPPKPGGDPPVRK
jgi:hypothetical protein